MSADAPGASVGRDTDAWPAYWRSLGYFALSRLVVAAVLIAYVPVLRGIGSLDEHFDASLFLSVAAVYLVAAIGFVVMSRPGRLPLRLLTVAQVAVDVVALMLLIHAAGGARSGLAVLLILPNAGAAILLGARLALFFSAASAVLLLLDTTWRVLAGDLGDGGFIPAGVIGAALLATAAILSRLAARLTLQEQLAWRRGEDLRNQLAITQAVIGELPEGVVVLGPQGEPRAINRAAREMLGAGASGTAPAGLLPLRAALGLASPGGAPPAGSAPETAEFVVPGVVGAPERRVRARRLLGAAGAADTVVVIEDLGALEARAQQLKLASMGRLSASIAHEIRNPLSAIRHANGLLAEQLDGQRLQRLAAIVEDNCRRIDRVIEDVLSISRRGSAAPEPLPPEA
ncbi:MAG: histidine kinase dimerization/phospho-acceptor domain-containing protein, partial [Burkholderiaceae bacterium]